MQMLLSSRFHCTQVRGKNEVKYEQAQGISQGAVLFEVGLDTTLNCIELTKETMQRKVLYIYYGADSEVESEME